MTGLRMAAERRIAYLDYSNGPKRPLYIFHHIPKCGGTALAAVLGQWFRLVRDQRVGWTERKPEKIDLSRLSSRHCIWGHFDVNGMYLGQRYPEVMNNEHYRLISFLRDPLAAKVSLYKYEAKHLGMHMSLEEHLLSRPNFLANRFPVNEGNYREVLDTYYFVGVIERAQYCVDQLASALGKPRLIMSIRNASVRDDSVAAAMTKELRDKFIEANRLDYLIYEYALNRLADCR